MIPLVVVATTWLSYALGWRLAVPLAMPLLNTAAAFPFLYRALRAGRLARAVGLMLVWAAAMAVAATGLSWWNPDRAGWLFVHGAQYRAEMFEWLRTGAGTESDPARFLPQHAWHAGLFCGLAILSGGIAAMPMGAVLMNYMGAYVGGLAAESARPLLTIVLAWPPWALLRVGAFVIVGVVLAAPLLARIGRFPFRIAEARPWLTAAGAGLVLDAGLKWQLAPVWRRWLAALVGW